MSKFAKMLGKVESEVVAMPTTKAPKERTVSSFNVKSATADEKRVLNVAWALKTIREKAGMGITEADKADLEAYARTKAPTLTGDIVEIIPSGVTGQLIRDAYYETTISAVIPFEEIQDVSVTRALKDEGLSVFRTGEGQDATASNMTFTQMRYVVDKIMAYTEVSYESMADSIIDLAIEAVSDMQIAFAEAYENAIINAHNVVADFDGTAWDATDFYGNAVTSANPITAFKGIRRIASEKGKVSFGGTALTDVEFLAKFHEMQRAGGKYLSKNKVARGEVACLVDLQTYQRMSRFTDIFERQIINGVMVESFDGVPVYQLDFIPATNASGIVDATPANNVKGTMLLINSKFFLAYSKANSTMVENDKNIKNQTMAFSMSNRSGFGGLYDATQTSFPVDVARKYAILGYNIA